MSAHLDYIDKEKRVLWISYIGRGDELEANLRTYGVEYIPAPHSGRVGIGYSRPAPEDKGKSSELSENAVTIVALLTIRSGVTRSQELDFAYALSVVQGYQRELAEATS